MKFTVRVPASTSNLGPGFDTLGLALNLYNDYSFETEDEKLSGGGGTAVLDKPMVDSEAKLEFSSNVAADIIPYSEENLVYRAFDHLFKKENQPTPYVKIHFEAGIPLTGGFGSSSTAIIAGLMAANKILGEPYNQEHILKIGTQLDGHPDNITPAILGGFVVCVYADYEHNYVKLPWDEELFFVAVTPDFKVPTAKARAALPAQLNYQDAIFNIGYSSLLVAAVAAKDTELLKKAFKDRLHQSYRAKLVPGMQYVLDTGLEAGAVGTMLSGAGAALIAVVDSEQVAETVGSAMQAAWRQYDIKADYQFLKAESEGARFL